jgi:hypothetical protein
MFMPPVKCEPAVQASELPQAYPSDSEATGISKFIFNKEN